MQDSESRERVNIKALVDWNGCSIVGINNVGGDPLLPRPQGAMLEKQFSVTALDKVPKWMWDIRIMQDQLSRVTIIFALRLELVS
jgi:hypothetical protein